jgi:glutathione S-transferase
MILPKPKGPAAAPTVQPCTIVAGQAASSTPPRPVAAALALLISSMAALAPAPLKLVGATAFRSFRNVWMLEELGVAYEHTVARPRSAEASAANPFGKIPSLTDGDFTMYESAAINTYLGDKFRAGGQAGEGGCPELVPPPGTAARGRYEQTTMCIMTELDAQGLWIHRKVRRRTRMRARARARCCLQRCA